MNEDYQFISFSQEEYKSYARHIIMPNINIEGQKRLKKAKILFVGAGGLATNALLYLTGAGVGSIGIVDDDFVELSNLHRQIIYTTQDIGEYKAKSAYKYLSKLNPHCKFQVYIAKLNKTNAFKIIKNYDIIIDSTDNFKTRYLLSDACHELHKIHIYGAVSSLEGQISVFNYQGGPSYKDIYPLLETTEVNQCINRGVLGVIPGMIGLLQATETLKIITGIGTILSEKILVYNSLNLSFRTINLQNIKIKGSQSINYEQDNVNNQPETNPSFISIHDLKQLKTQQKDIVYLIDIRNYFEYQMEHLLDSVNIPLSKLTIHTNLNLLKSIAVNKYIIIYCSSKTRSYIASFLLKQANIKHWILNTSQLYKKE